MNLCQNKFTYVYKPRKIEQRSDIEYYRNWSFDPYDLRSQSVIQSNYNMNGVSKVIALFILLAGGFYNTYI